jgi:RNA polymerase sigma-70 factor (ECF subfamily)
MTKTPASTSASPSDEELALRARAGCRTSFEQLVRRYQVPLVHFLRRWTTIEEAEDLTQDTVLRAYENLHRYRPAWKFGTWLFTIARRLCLNRRRRWRPAGGAEPLPSLVASSQPADEVADAESGRQLWATAAKVLTERERTTLWLYYTEDMPVAEIARVVGRSASAVKTMLFRSRKKLAKAIDPHEAASRETSPANASRGLGIVEKAEVTHE